jgi:predicted transcriptional regulator
MSAAEAPAVKQGWTFLTNHGHVLVCIATDPAIRGRDIATQVGITERAAQAIVADLVAEGYLERTRVGRRNHYQIAMDRKLRHPLEHAHRIGELLMLATPDPGRSPSNSEREP